MTSQWWMLVDAERVAREQAYDAQNTDGERDALRKWWKAVEDLLRSAVVAQTGVSPGSIPPELLLALSGLAGHLAVGDLPDPVAKVVSKGSISPRPLELHDIRIAVTYRRAAGKGMIKDDTPTKTLMEAYGLGDRTTLQKWFRKYEPFDLSEYQNDPQNIEVRMAQSGARYKAAGRSQSAIKRRGNQ